MSHDPSLLAKTEILLSHSIPIPSPLTSSPTLWTETWDILKALHFYLASVPAFLEGVVAIKIEMLVGEKFDNSPVYLCHLNKGLVRTFKGIVHPKMKILSVLRYF